MLVGVDGEGDVAGATAAARDRVVWNRTPVVPLLLLAEGRSKGSPVLHRSVAGFLRDVINSPADATATGLSPPLLTWPGVPGVPADIAGKRSQHHQQQVVAKPNKGLSLQKQTYPPHPPPPRLNQSSKHKHSSTSVITNTNAHATAVTKQPEKPKTNLANNQPISSQGSQTHAAVRPITERGSGHVVAVVPGKKRVNIEDNQSSSSSQFTIGQQLSDVSAREMTSSPTNGQAKNRRGVEGGGEARAGGSPSASPYADASLGMMGGKTPSPSDDRGDTVAIETAIDFAHTTTATPARSRSKLDNDSSSPASSLHDSAVETATDTQQQNFNSSTRAATDGDGLAETAIDTALFNAPTTADTMTTTALGGLPPVLSSMQSQGREYLTSSSVVPLPPLVSRAQTEPIISNGLFVLAFRHLLNKVTVDVYNL